MIRVVPHDPDWAAQYQAEARQVTAAVGAPLIALHHIGSTSVAGLAAKPIIDMLLEVTSLDALDRVTPAIEHLGYEAMGEFGISGRRYFRRDDAQGIRSHQIHAFAADTANVRRHLAFRDYLRAHRAVADQYGLLKQQLAQQHPADLGAYNDGKDSFVKEHERIALRWVDDQR
ncbi:GrpB family protein [Pseudoxanthomonas dokdonensis]|uniref:GrpB family protein n=1 Tax=Pseudoxanthomonas dokdonensis TaxID=344882 RepID=A0A0R0CN39_9GAMM|nr:GrpB family protein [Pseudoxanthomonas dokdonensis]KRG70960.1 hypothetical protein ABB29_03770 [Pseudoxanthomonas dokdonensis]